MVFGNDYSTPDGTGVRHYTHVMDLAAGHWAALDYLTTPEGVLTWNLGTGSGSSVLQVVQAFREAAGHPVPFEFAACRLGDAAVSYADSSAVLVTWASHHTAL